MRKYLFIVVLSIFVLPLAAEKQYTVVLDAGHGGKDPGAVGKFSKEKDLNLKLVLKMGELINEQYPDVNVVYTRNTDVFIPLQTRADIANKNNADLFISIHTNSSENKAPRGVETFILGTDKMEKNLDVAMRENAVMKLEADYKTTYQGFDPNSIDSYIMFELMQNSYMDQSLRFAEQVQKRFVGHLNREDRGVRQAAFWVLLKTACPSILFEMGFISNPEEERFLNQPASIAQMANAIVNAFGAYTHKQALKAETLETSPASAASTSTGSDTSATSASAGSSASATSASAEISTPAPAEQKNEIKTDSCRTKNEPILDHTASVTDELQVPATTPVTYFAVQICASRTPLAPNDPKLKGQPCEFVQVGEWYKYYTAADTNRAKVQTAQQELKSLFPDCWIIKIEK